MNESSHDDALRRWSSLLALPANEMRREALCWDWYSLIRLVQSAHPGSPRTGYSVLPGSEPVRLGQPPFFHHPQTTISDLKRLDGNTGTAGGDQLALLYSHHIGMFGPHGPLPLHLTEYADRQTRGGDPGFVAFCNVISHRFISFFFRAWADGRKETTLDRPGAIPDAQRPYALQDIAQHGENLWEFFIGSLVGCGLDSKRFADHLNIHSRLYHAGRFLPQNRSAEGLRAIIEDYFKLCPDETESSRPQNRQVRARIIEFQPRTLPIPKSAQWRMGTDRSTGFLGLSTIVGSSVVDYQSGFRIQIGPLDFKQFSEFLPDDERFRQLHDWVRYYCGEDTDPNPEAGLEASWEMQLILVGPEVPKLVLGDKTKLGYTTWLFSEKPRHNVGDLVVRPRRASARKTTPGESPAPTRAFD